MPTIAAASRSPGSRVPRRLSLSCRASRYRIGMVEARDSALATICGAVVVFEHDLGDVATLLTIAALAAWIAAVLTTFLVYVPLLETVSRLDAGTDAAERDSVVGRWTSVHFVRTVLFLCGFGLFVAAALAA